MDDKNFYDRYYYLTSCGISYDNKESWQSFFGTIADRIVSDINPKTVLDAGCAYGYLVAALRDRGVEAYGIDISEYAINQVREDIRPYCSVGSVLDPLDRQYDLIICIEVIEHLAVQDGRTMIENLCRHTSDFVFTSTPADFKEATHFNVHPTEYWAKLFASCNFFRDIEFDGSFIIDHAIRFRKQQHTLPEIIYDYEKGFFKNYIENKTLRSELIKSRAELSQRFNENESSLLAEKNQIIKDKDRHIYNLDSELRGKSAHISEIERILKAKEEYIGHLEGLTKQKEAALNERSEQLKHFEDNLHELDRQQLFQIEKIIDGNNNLLGEKDKQLKTWEEHVRQLHNHLSLLDNIVFKTEEKHNELAEYLNQLNGSIEYLNKTIANKGEQLQHLSKSHDDGTSNSMAETEDRKTIEELTHINEEYRQKLISSYNDRNMKDKLLHDLNLQLNSLKLGAEIPNSQNQAIIIEFERIKRLKGYKLLMKYYMIRDRLLRRHKPGNTSKKNSVNLQGSSVSADKASPIASIATGETILQMERKYFSSNPIYNVEFAYVPLISVIVPVYNTPISILKEMIESVLDQTYSHLELCIVNGSAENTQISSCIKKYMETDDRVVYIEVENKGIAENTNAGIKLAKGEFIALLDHDDIITPHALFEVVYRLQDDITLYDFFYSDKDMMLEHGETSVNPLYKPQWSPEIMFSANYLTHFCVIRKSLLEKAGLLDSGTDGSQDWDIFLKVSRLTDRICHIPSILYHWRIVNTSVASGIGAKPYALQAQLTSLKNHLTALNQKAVVYFASEEKGIIKVDWEAPDTKKISFIVTHSADDYLLKKLFQQINAFKTAYGYETEIVVLTQESIDVDKLGKGARIVNANQTNIYESINAVTPDLIGDILLFADSKVNFTDEHSINQLVIWAAQKPYGAISPKIIDSKEKILSTGLVLNGNSVVDIFRGTEKVEYTIFGYTEWYRNITSVRQECFAINATLLSEVGYFNPEYKEFSCVELCLRLSKHGYRHVYNPFSVVQTSMVADLNNFTRSKYFSTLRDIYQIKECDRHWNINLQSTSSIPVENKRKLLRFTSPKLMEVRPQTGWEKYSTDALYLANAFDFSTADFKKNSELIASNRNYIDIKSVNWFLPHFDFIYYAGLYTIFRFANYLQSVKKVKNTFIIVGGIDSAETYNMIIEAFPLLKDSKVISLAGISEIDKAPYADASICSLWTTAYYLLRFNKTKRKFYFIQDFEPLFYPAGSTFGQTETTYKFGFYGIANTEGIRKIYESQYNGKAIDLKPCIDTTVFHHNNRHKPLHNKYNVFFYGRPGHPRNGFELGSAALRILKTKLGEKVEIFCAGAEWDPKDYGLEGVVNNIGRMDFEKTADLYRICDVGLVMMFTKHPSYLPFELMACGCAVVSNYNNDTKWFLKENVNCLLTEATATRIAETIEELLLNNALRNKLVENAIADIRNNHTSWDIELNTIYDYMCQPENVKTQLKTNSDVKMIK
ncbi:rhamnosyltransferase WsaF family glycosyltransferase [Terrimonas pollutisoli]|uniref:rhamnosyltransferase WsaF family glycosyltransferase n=1 Tax=Terrimonas pollutisoli TaxID=3034147 RepID=UPI0023ED5377|nr:glycosyltransferase [Terrimonas sp. H1YJ31]